MIKDKGLSDMFDGLVHQVRDKSRDDKGLSILILWNNQLTNTASAQFNRVIVSCYTNISRYNI